MVHPINGFKVPQRGATHEVEGILRIVEGLVTMVEQQVHSNSNTTCSNRIMEQLSHFEQFQCYHTQP